MSILLLGFQSGQTPKVNTVAFKVIAELKFTILMHTSSDLHHLIMCLRNVLAFVGHSIKLLLSYLLACAKDRLDFGYDTTLDADYTMVAWADWLW